MLNFYPGPSRVNAKLPKYMLDAYREGILSINHRSPAFEEISKNCIKYLKKKLQIPKEYSVYYTSSATETWEIIGQSFIRKKSFHIFNGAFGRKWYAYTKKLKSKAHGFEFGPNHLLSVSKLNIPKDVEIICLTQNETSNATQISNKVIAKIRSSYPDNLIAVDATSSMAGIQLDFKNADIWYASVQKCFGLPAGLGIMICSPEALDHAAKIKERRHYNSFNFMVEKMQDYQTTYTPNVFSIYLLSRVMKNAPKIGVTHNKLIERYDQWINFFSEFNSFELMHENKAVRSSTVIGLKTEPEMVDAMHRKANESGIVLGQGYGDLKSTTIRIANFPAIKQREIKLCKQFFKRHFD